MPRHGNLHRASARPLRPLRPLVADSAANRSSSGADTHAAPANGGAAWLTTSAATSATPAATPAATAAAFTSGRPSRRRCFRRRRSDTRPRPGGGKPAVFGVPATRFAPGAPAVDGFLRIESRCAGRRGLQRAWQFQVWCFVLCVLREGRRCRMYVRAYKPVSESFF